MGRAYGLWDEQKRDRTRSIAQPSRKAIAAVQRAWGLERRDTHHRSVRPFVLHSYKAAAVQRAWWAERRPNGERLGCGESLLLLQHRIGEKLRSSSREGLHAARLDRAPKRQVASASARVLFPSAAPQGPSEAASAGVSAGGGGGGEPSQPGQVDCLPPAQDAANLLHRGRGRGGVDRGEGQARQAHSGGGGAPRRR